MNLEGAWTAIGAMGSNVASSVTEVLQFLLLAVTQIFALISALRRDFTQFTQSGAEDLTSLQLALQQIHDAVGSPCPLGGEVFTTVWAALEHVNDRVENPENLIMQMSQFDDVLTDIRSTIEELKGQKDDYGQKTEQIERFSKALMAPNGLLTWLKHLLQVGDAAKFRDLERRIHQLEMGRDTAGDDLDELMDGLDVVSSNQDRSEEPGPQYRDLVEKICVIKTQLNGKPVQVGHFHFDSQEKFSEWRANQIGDADFGNFVDFKSLLKFPPWGLVTRSPNF